MSDNFPEAKAVLRDEIANLRYVETNRSCLLINRNRSAAALEKVFTTNCQSPIQQEWHCRPHLMRRDEGVVTPHLTPFPHQMSRLPSAPHELSVDES